MTLEPEFDHEISDQPDVGIMMPDGVRLSARIWMPATAHEHPVPAVLEYIPYRKRDGTLLRDEGMHPDVARHGYACVRVDMRGNGDSAGLMDDEYTRQEMDDALVVIDWLSRQPWCTGAVGMMGKSWGGFNCLQAAFNRPPALKAVISVCATTDRFADDIHFKGGCLLGENLGWGAVMLSYSSRPADPMLREGWRDDWLKRLNHLPFLSPVWAARQTRDCYWQHGSVCEDWNRINIPILIVGGWADNYLNTLGALMEHQSGMVQALMGPWGHQYPHTALPGPQIDFIGEMVRWWDCWLKGRDNGVAAGPRYRAYMQHSQPVDACAPYRHGHWVVEQNWPSPRVRMQALPLSKGRLGGQGGALEVQVKTPQHLGLQGGEFFPMGVDAELPGDQRGDDALSVCFDSDAFEQGARFLGQAVLQLRLRADRPFAHIIARLCDVAPDGSSTRISHGMLNLRHRGSMAAPGPVPVNEALDIALKLDHMGYELAPGHHLRLALSTNYWPFVWPAPEAATLTLESGTLELPFHHSDGAQEWQPAPPAPLPPSPHRRVAPETAVRRIEHDMIANEYRLIVEDDGGLTENADHGMIYGNKTREEWVIAPDDPLSAKVNISYEQFLRRGEWSVKTVAVAQMTAGRDMFHFDARIEAFEAEQSVFVRQYKDNVAREQM